MSQAELLPNPLTETALRLSSRIGYLLIFAVMFVGSAWVVEFPVPGLILLLIGLTFLFLAITIFGLSAYHEHAQKRFSDCGCVKRDCDLSVRGHGSLRGRAVRLMMVFGGGLSPMSFAG